MDWSPLAKANLVVQYLIIKTYISNIHHSNDLSNNMDQKPIDIGHLTLNSVKKIILKNVDSLSSQFSLLLYNP